VSKITLSDSNSDIKTSHNELTSLIESLKHEVSTLRSEKVKLEQSLANEKKQGSYLSEIPPLF
jgi:chromosome segregation ATPase